MEHLLGRGCRIRISPWAVGKMGLECWGQLLRGTLCRHQALRALGQNIFFIWNLSFSVCLCNVHWMEGRRKWGRSDVGKPLGEKCQEILTNHTPIKNVTALLTSGGAARSHPRTGNLSRANFLWHFQGCSLPAGKKHFVLSPSSSHGKARKGEVTGKKPQSELNFS